MSLTILYLERSISYRYTVSDLILMQPQQIVVPPPARNSCWFNQVHQWIFSSLTSSNTEQSHRSFNYSCMIFINQMNGAIDEDRSPDTRSSAKTLESLQDEGTGLRFSGLAHWWWILRCGTRLGCCRIAIVTARLKGPLVGSDPVAVEMAGQRNRTIVQHDRATQWLILWAPATNTPTTFHIDRRLRARISHRLKKRRLAFDRFRSAGISWC